MTYPSGDQPPQGQPYQPYPQPAYQPYPQQYGMPPGGQPRRRGRTPLILALIFGVVGIVLLIVGVVVGLTQGLQRVDSFSRVPIAQGRGTADFPSAGNYLAYYEASNVSSSIRSVPLPVVVMRSPSGQLLRLDTLYGGASRSSLQIKSFLTYQYHGHNGVAIYQFHISQPGQYEVAVIPTGNEAPGADVAFGKSIAGGLAAGVILLVIGVLLIIAAIVLLIVGVVKYTRSGKQIAAAGAYGGYGGSPPGYGGSPPGYGYPPPPQ